MLQPLNGKEKRDAIEQMIQDKKRVIILLEESVERFKGDERFLSIILDKIEKEKEDLDEFIKRNTTTEEEFHDVTVPIKPYFQNSDFTPELWDPKEIESNYQGDYDAQDDYFFNGFLKLPSSKFGRSGNISPSTCMCNLMSLTPGVLSNRSEIIPESIYVKAILSRILDKDDLKSIRYKIITLWEPKRLLYRTDCSYLYNANTIIDIEEEVGAYSFGVHCTRDSNPGYTHTASTRFVNLPRLQAALFGTFDMREGSLLRLSTTKAIDDYNCISPIIGVKLMGRIQIN